MDYREAGLPPLVNDHYGERQLLMGSKGVVRFLRPEINRVDIETEEGGLLTNVMVIGPYFPQLHTDGDEPSHVAYLHMRGMADAICWPMTFRRLLGRQDRREADGTEPPPERRFYETHSYIYRSGNITTRITYDQRWVIEGEAGDYLQYDEVAREIRIHAPSVFVGTETESRIEYARDQYVKVITPATYIGTDTANRFELHVGDDVPDQAQLVMPQFYLGAQGLPDSDGVSYTANVLLHLVSTLIRLTAGQVVIESSNTLFGSAAASERLLLGDSWMALYNTFITLFNAHTHGGVQTGGGASGAPIVGAVPMTAAQLSSVARVSP
jgi:hypothetical protein